MDILDNKGVKEKDYQVIEKSIIETIERIDQKHPIERKIKFFLDVRGYLKLNVIKGSYIEFGSYQSWTQFAAYKILDKTMMIDKYYGCDIFSGEPAPNIGESENMPVMQKGDFKVNYDEVKNFVDNMLQGKGDLIKGDFREDKIKNKIKNLGPFNVVILDCNLESSMQAALEISIDHLSPGAILFVDDYFTNFGKGKAVIEEMIKSSIQNKNLHLIEHGFYPPFAKSFIIATV